MNQRQFGQQGEQLVEGYLHEKGFELLERNFLRRVGEIDLIGRDKETDEIVFIEVKTRTTNTFGYPEEAVGPKKLHKIEKTAYQWLQQNKKLDSAWRIDIIALELKEKTKITHLKNVSL